MYHKKYINYIKKVILQNRIINMIIIQMMDDIG